MVLVAGAIDINGYLVTKFEIPALIAWGSSLPAADAGDQEHRHFTGFTDAFMTFGNWRS